MALRCKSRRRERTRTHRRGGEGGDGIAALVEEAIERYQYRRSVAVDLRAVTRTVTIQYRYRYSHGYGYSG